LARRSAERAIPVPIDAVALTFEDVSEFAFLTRTGADDVPADWPMQMANDTLDFDAVPTSISFEHFALNDYAAAERARAVPHRVQWVLQASPERDELMPSYHLVFWAGLVGAHVIGASLRVRTHDGDLSLRDMDELRDAWWEYWRAYWARRGSPDALPYDPSCETVIPFK